MRKNSVDASTAYPVPSAETMMVPGKACYERNQLRGGRRAHVTLSAMETHPSAFTSHELSSKSDIVTGDLVTD